MNNHQVHVSKGQRAGKRAIGPVTFELVDRYGAVREILNAVRDKSSRVFAFCNMHTFNIARRSGKLAKALNTATVFNDGLGIDIASRILFDEKFPDNLNGTDLMPLLFESFDWPVSVFLVGSSTEVVETAARMLESRFPLVTVVGSHHGFFNAAEGEEIVNRVRASGTDLLVLGMGNPRQELWAHEIAGRTNAAIVCVGAFLDFASGKIPRAPRVVRALRSEWLFRLAREPLRLSGRYLGGAPIFLCSVLSEKFRTRRKRPLKPNFANSISATVSQSPSDNEGRA